VAAVFGGSPVQVSGPTGAMAVVLAPTIAAHGASSVALVSILAGLLVLVAGIARLGRLVGYLPWPVILRLSRLHILDATGAKALGEAIEELETRGVTVLVKGVQQHHRHLLTTTGALGKLRHGDHLFTTLDEAVTHARSHVRHEGHPAAT